MAIKKISGSNMTTQTGKVLAIKANDTNIQIKQSTVFTTLPPSIVKVFAANYSAT